MNFNKRMEEIEKAQKQLKSKYDKVKDNLIK